MLPTTRSGLPGVRQAGSRFAPVTERVIGNNSPGWTGSPGNIPDVPGPHAPGQPIGGNLGNYDGYSGPDPHAPQTQPPHVQALSPMQETAYRPGITGFNDRLQYRDRHAYWSRGYMRTGISPSVPGNPPNPLSDGPPAPALRTVNVSVNPQQGSDHTRNQDDLSRPYTWLGQQDGSVQPVYGGVPGLWAAYGNRGLASGIHDPSNGQGGLSRVWSGPPHGLHSDTMPAGKQIADRYKVNPQMRPVRQDRPANSTSAGQSYSQTVLPQGSTAAPAQRPGMPSVRASVQLRTGNAGGWRGK
jgi:hypothetical protein